MIRSYDLLLSYANHYKDDDDIFSYKKAVRI